MVEVVGPRRIEGDELPVRAQGRVQRLERRAALDRERQVGRLVGEDAVEPRERQHDVQPARRAPPSPRRAPPPVGATASPRALASARTRLTPSTVVGSATKRGRDARHGSRTPARSPERSRPRGDRLGELPADVRRG